MVYFPPLETIQLLGILWIFLGVSHFVWNPVWNPPKKSHHGSQISQQSPGLYQLNLFQPDQVGDTD